MTVADNFEPLEQKQSYIQCLKIQRVLRLGGTLDAGAETVQRSEEARRQQQRQDLQTAVGHGDQNRKLIINL